MRNFLNLRKANSLDACIPVDMVISVEEVLRCVVDDGFHDEFVEITYKLGEGFKSILVTNSYESIVTAMKEL